MLPNGPQYTVIVPKHMTKENPSGSLVELTKKSLHILLRVNYGLKPTCQTAFTPSQKS